MTLKRVSVPLKTWRGRRALFERLVFHVTNRRQAVWITPFFFFWPVITKISTSLNASNLGEWKWSSPGERKTGPLARLRGLSLMLLAWHGRSPWLGHLFRRSLSHLAPGGWETIGFSLHAAMTPGRPQNIYILNSQWPVNVWVLIQN